MSGTYKYTYTRLEKPSHQIRLLKLNRSYDDGAVLTGTLSVYDIPERDASVGKRLLKHLGLPAYCAISYVWGEAAPSPLLDHDPGQASNHEIILDGRRFPLTANLHSALHYYRSVNPASTRFWVDAICINQADTSEKSDQIPLMSTIYYLSTLVLVWLGKVTPETQRLEDFFQKLTEINADQKVRETVTRIRQAGTKDGDEVGQQKHPLPLGKTARAQRLLLGGAYKSAVGFLKGMNVATDLVYNSLSDNTEVRENGVWMTMEEVMSWSPSERQLKLVEHYDIHEMSELCDKMLFSETQYFDRMWTLQELCVAGRGSVWLFDVDLHDILAAIYYIQRTYDIHMLSIDKITPLLEVNAKFNNGQRQSLRILLAVSAGRKSEDPRDRIYAVQGLMKDVLNPLLRPDYEKSVEEVYSNTARHIIASERSLNVICGQRQEGRLPGLPTWVHDFRFFALQTETLIQAGADRSIYQASLSEQHTLPKTPFHLSDEWQTITVTGIPLGIVSQISDIIEASSEFQTRTFAHDEQLWAREFIQNHTQKPEDVEAINRASDLVRRYAEYYGNSDRATFAARNPDKIGKIRSVTGKINEETGAPFESFIQYFLTLLCGRLEPGSRCGEDELLEHMAKICLPTHDGVESLETLCKALDLGIRRRRPIIFGDHRFGAAPAEAQKGDLLYTLMGCSVPVVLRSTTRAAEFELVGECYLHGFMDGEALALRDGDKVTASEFKLV